MALIAGGLVIEGANQAPFENAGAPTNGTSGTYAGSCRKGSLLIDTTNGNLYVNTNTAASPTWTGIPSAVGAGYRVARGETALDGSNPTPVAHGLTTCIAFAATLKGTAAPGVGTSSLSANINGANVDVYAWKVTTSADNTLIASTGTESFYWVAVGT